MSTISVTHESPSQRKQFRITAPAQVGIGGVWHYTVDWSVQGFRISPFRGEAKPSDILSVDFSLDFQGFHISFPAQAEVVRREGEELAAKFPALGERETSLLRQFETGVLGGQLTAVDGVLKHLDRPVTKVALTPPIEPLPVARRRIWMRAVVSVIYLIAGLALIGFSAVILSRLWTTLRVDTAVTSTALEQVVSTDAGVIRELAAQPGAVFKAGQILLRVESEVAAHGIDVARQQLQTAQADALEARQLVGQEQSKLAAYRSIGGDQTEIHRARIKALTAAREEARLEFERTRQLWEYGLVARQVYDSHASSVVKHDAALEQAEAELRVVNTSNQSINSGLFFSGNYLVGDLQARLGQEEAATARVQVAERALRDALRQEARHEYRAPFDGAVLRVFKSNGMTVDRGEAVLILRKSGEAAHVDAYLTQEEAGFVTQGARAFAYVPALNRTYDARVLTIDRTSGFLKEVQTPKLHQPQFNWRNVQDRSAYVRLEFAGLSVEDLQQMQTGLPVQVTIERKRDAFMSFLEVLDIPARK